MANKMIYQSIFQGEQIDARLTAVQSLQEALASVEQAITAKYTKPASGIPETDLDEAVQSALAKARSAVQDLSNYYTKTEIDALLSAVNSQQYVDVTALPTASADTLGKIYLVGPDANNQYARYYTSYDGSAYSWVAAGTTEINLANYATKAELNQLSQEINGEPEEVESTWGAWVLGGTPNRAFTIATDLSAINGVISIKLSSYSVYKIDVAIQDGTTWESTKISDTGWQTSDIVKQISATESGYRVRVAIGRVDNRAISLTEFLSVISELRYEYISLPQGGLVSRINGIEHSVSELSTILDVIPDYIVEDAQMVDIASLTEYDYTMSSNKKFEIQSSKHKAIPVVAGEKYVISGDGNNFWAWLTSSYSPPVSRNLVVPYVSGYQRECQKGAVAVTVPSGAAYLCFSTKNGVGVVSSWNIYKVSSYKRRFVNYQKFRVAHWNIGGFVYTDWEVGEPTHAIPAADAPTYAQKYRELINKTNADLLGIAEYNPAFSDAKWVTKDIIFQCYRKIYEGTKTGANCNTVMMNMCDYVSAEQIKFSDSSYNRYYTHSTLRLNGENVHFVEAHMDHTYNEMRVAEIAQIIADMAGYKYVIIVGDFNTGDKETISTEMSAFTNAGYTIANGGYVGFIVTSLTQEYVDHIVVRGFAMSNIQTSTESGTLSDHLLISCDLIMQDI